MSRLILIALSILLLIMLIMGLHYRKKMKVEGKFTFGIVKSVTSGGRSHGGEVFFEYDYFVKGEIIRGSAYKTVKDVNFYKLRDSIIGKRFVVKYLPDEKDFSYILITPEDYSKNNLKFPDSLSWAKSDSD